MTTLQTETTTPSYAEARDRGTATLFGVAFGDALGKPTEFVYDYSKIVRNRLGVKLPYPEAVVTDDTEMTMATARALRLIGFDTPQPGYVEDALRYEYIVWRNQNVWGRAAGHTCLRGAEKLETWSTPWQFCTSPLAKGCGANMRVAPIGLVPLWTAEDVANVAQLSSALTHGHPTALAAAELTALAVWYLRSGVTTLGRLPHLLLDRCRSQRSTYRREWLGTLADHWRAKGKRRRGHASDETAQRAIRVGWLQCEKVLLNVTHQLRRRDDRGDISKLCGAGWIAEEALATALYAAVRYREHPRYALQRAAQTSGDSDSLAAIAGSFLGAAYGVDAFPSDWYDRVEYADELRRLSSLWN